MRCGCRSTLPARSTRVMASTAQDIRSLIGLRFRAGSISLVVSKLGGLWQSGVQYRVTARWGYEATPSDVTEACRQWAVYFFERQKGTLGQITPNGFVI